MRTAGLPELFKLNFFCNFSHEKTTFYSIKKTASSRIKVHHLPKTSNNYRLNKVNKLN